MSSKRKCPICGHTTQRPEGTSQLSCVHCRFTDATHQFPAIDGEIDKPAECLCADGPPSADFKTVKALASAFRHGLVPRAMTDDEIEALGSKVFSQMFSQTHPPMTWGDTSPAIRAFWREVVVGILREAIV